MSGGGKGGETVQTTKIDPRLEEGAVQTLAAALRSASVPYSPNRGVTIAAFSPQQKAAMMGANAAAGAFGLPTGEVGSTLPQEVMGAGGAMGYSTSDLYDQNRGLSLTPEEEAQRAMIQKSYADAADSIQALPGFSGLTTDAINATSIPRDSGTFVLPNVTPDTSAPPKQVKRADPTTEHLMPGGDK